MVNHAHRWQPVPEHTAPADPTPDEMELINSDLMSIAEVTARLRVSRAKLDRLFAAGKIAKFQDGPKCRVLVPKLSVERYLAANLKGAK